MEKIQDVSVERRSRPAIDTAGMDDLYDREPVETSGSGDDDTAGQPSLRTLIGAEKPQFRRSLFRR
jgi:hypothetical protein